ncbi:MAG TPA: RNA methyltransferase [Steroidobacteraceae bacterium]|nr:RNA methyltransferase [Steroidobacteraceae bacterium]
MESPQNLLDRVRIVLVEPQHPGNIGGAARAMKTMGLRELALVKPDKFPHKEATDLAVGAADLLEAAIVHPDLRSAVADCAYVVGTSARLRSLPHNTSTPRELAERLAREVGGRIALVFGPERVGLSNEDFELCHALVSVPADPTFRVLNLAAAVQIVCYELRLAAAPELSGKPEHVPVDQREMELFFEHLERVLVDIGFLNPKHPRQLMRRLRRMYSRAAPDENEMNILRGILAAVQGHSKPHG